MEAKRNTYSILQDQPLSPNGIVNGALSPSHRASPYAQSRASSKGPVGTAVCSRLPENHSSIYAHGAALAGACTCIRPVSAPWTVLRSVDRRRMDKGHRPVHFSLSRLPVAARDRRLRRRRSTLPILGLSSARSSWRQPSLIHPLDNAMLALNHSGGTCSQGVVKRAGEECQVRGCLTKTGGKPALDPLKTKNHGRRMPDDECCAKPRDAFDATPCQR